VFIHLSPRTSVRAFHKFSNGRGLVIGGSSFNKVFFKEECFMATQLPHGFLGIACIDCGYDESRCICSFTTPIVPVATRNNSFDDWCDDGGYDDSRYPDFDDLYPDTDEDMWPESAESSPYGDGCMHCGHYAENCICDEWPEFDWEEMERAWEDRHQAETFPKFRFLIKRRSKFHHLPAKLADDAQDNLEEHRNNCSHGHSWKRSNRKARKQWARHPHRAIENVKFMSAIEVAHFDKEVERRRQDADAESVWCELRNNPHLAMLKKKGYPYDRFAYNAAREEVRLRRLENDEKLALLGPTHYEVQVVYDSRQSERWAFDIASEELSYLQDLYEPHNLEDLGRQGLWSPPLPAGFNVITDHSFDHYGDLRRPKLLSKIDILNRMECFQNDAYEDEDRDDDDMRYFREDSSNEWKFMLLQDRYWYGEWNHEHEISISAERDERYNFGKWCLQVPEADDFIHLMPTFEGTRFGERKLRNSLKGEETSWKRLTRAKRQWERHEHRILANVVSIGGSIKTEVSQTEKQAA
jgi:hypothetical protein